MEQQDKQKLSKHPLFAGTALSELEAVLETHGNGVRSFADREVILSPDDDSAQLGLLLSGKATVSTPSDSHAVLLRFLEAGDLFGIANLFSKERFISIIRADGNCRCLFFSEAAVEQLLTQSHAFRQAYIGFLSGRVRFLNRKIGYLTAGSAERRLALYLSSLGSGESRLPDSLTSLSDLLNLGRASLYRAFDKLSDDGLIVKHGRTILIPDAKALKEAYK